MVSKRHEKLGQIRAAVDFFKKIRANAPQDNPMITEALERVERRFLNDLYEEVSEMTTKRANKGP